MNEYYKNLPRKRMAAGAFIFDADGRVLVVKPTYKDTWSIPGGVVDRDESPRAACIREICEEIGLDIPVGPLICVDYSSGGGEKDESLQFIFYGGTLDDESIRQITLDEKEIAEFRFAAPSEAVELFGGEGRSFARRARRAFEAFRKREAVYLEDGE